MADELATGAVAAFCAGLVFGVLVTFSVVIRRDGPAGAGPQAGRWSRPLASVAEGVRRVMGLGVRRPASHSQGR